MVLVALEFTLGLFVVGLTLQDVFDTVVVPGESRALLQVLRRLVVAGVPLLQRIRGHAIAIPTAFGPFILVASFVIWMLLLMLGFGLIAHALRDWYQPPLPSFSQAVFVAGSSLVTVGLSETDATGPARWVNVAAGFCGLGVMTLAVTYLLQVQTAVAQRDAGILKLTTSAGDPPSAIGLLVRYAELGCQKQLPEVLVMGRDWCADVLQSHASHPSLIYFRSKNTGSGWPATLGTLMDFAVLLEAVVDAPELHGPATLLREQGTRMARELVSLLRLDCDPVAGESAAVAQLVRRVRDAGYLVRKDQGGEKLVTLRQDYAPLIAAVARHLGAPQAPLLPNVASRGSPRNC